MEEYGLALLLPSGTNSPWKEKLFKIKYMCTHAKKKKQFKDYSSWSKLFPKKTLEAKHHLHTDVKVWFCKLILYFLPPVLKQSLLPKSINLYGIVEYSYLNW